MNKSTDTHTSGVEIVDVREEKENFVCLFASGWYSTVNKRRLGTRKSHARAAADAASAYHLKLPSRACPLLKIGLQAIIIFFGMLFYKIYKLTLD